MKLIKIKNIKTKNTFLSVFQNINKFMRVKRIFFVNSNKPSLSGDHAHKKCTQVLLSVSGNIKIEIIDDKLKKKFFLLKELENYIIIRPKNWVKVHFKKKQKLMVLCDYNYSKSDYINDFNTLKKGKF